MPRSAKTACPRGGCPNVQPCPTHTRRPWAHAIKSRQARGYDRTYTRGRAIVMSEEDTCWLCGGVGRGDDQADHKLALARGGTNDRANLRRAHKACNERRGRAHS